MTKYMPRKDKHQGRRKHKLMTVALAKRLPPLGTYQTHDKALAQVKYFHPFSTWEWYGCEFDGQDILYGLVIGDFIEYGSFSLSELEGYLGRHGLPIERDLYFHPKPMKEVEAYHRQQRGEI